MDVVACKDKYTWLLSKAVLYFGFKLMDQVGLSILVVVRTNLNVDVGEVELDMVVVWYVVKYFSSSAGLFLCVLVRSRFDLLLVLRWYNLETCCESCICWYYCKCWSQTLW